MVCWFKSPLVRMLVAHTGHNKTIQVYSVTVMTDVRALQARQSSHGTFVLNIFLFRKTNKHSSHVWFSNKHSSYVWFSNRHSSYAWFSNKYTRKINITGYIWAFYTGIQTPTIMSGIIPPLPTIMSGIIEPFTPAFNLQPSWVVSLSLLHRHSTTSHHEWYH